jgi:asparagine synthase (glutamine-hydrolysing)
MCGIAGLYAFNPTAPPADRAELRAIRDHMTARRPDGQGEWFSPDGRIAFGHRRLAIIDLTEGGAHPCTVQTANW